MIPGWRIRLLLLAATLAAAACPAYGADNHSNADLDSASDQGADDDTGTDVKETPRRVPHDTPAQGDEADRLRVGSATHVRRFAEVLDELLAEFGYDVKTGQIKGLANLAVRKVRVSAAIPRTYEDYVELLLDERIRENSQVRLIDCVPCKTRTSQIVGGKLMITSPATNMAKLDQAATELGIEYFMDAVLVYHTTHMVLAVDIFNAKTKELVWARTYNSETIKSRYQKLAVDYHQVEVSRPGEDYVPEYRLLFGFGGAALPNVGGTSADSTMLNLQIRATERFDNRRSEFGLLLSYLKTTSALVHSYPTEPSTASSTSQNPPETEQKTVANTPKPFTQAYALYGVYAHVFLGAVESYNEVRQGFHIGLGPFVATGYLAPAACLGWDVFLGRRFALSFAGDYVGPASILLDGQSVKTTGGAGGDVIMSFNY